ncbi:Maf family protein [Piscirickettsia salmonis]|uniref:Maf family protein n=1 Tax=Piscirickettsia salmonis TaxID=1238 RepID=UPI003A800638
MRSLKMHLVLASSSPYRAKLLQRLGLKFSQYSPNIDETPHHHEDISDLVLRLAKEKAHAVAEHYQSNQQLIIASDQAAILDQHILSKPYTHDNAIKQLSTCSGRAVTFFTSLCLLNTTTGESQLTVEPFSVYFRKLSAQEIETYLKREKPYQCAGSFKSEGLGISLFEKMVGDDPNSLIGLPLIKLVQFLKNQGINPLA